MLIKFYYNKRIDNYISVFHCYYVAYRLKTYKHNVVETRIEVKLLGPRPNQFRPSAIYFDFSYKILIRYKNCDDGIKSLIIISHFV